MTVCYFTATGNCLYVARRIGGTLLSIPQLMKQPSISIKDDAVGIVSPVYAVEMPMMVKAFIEKASIKTDYFFFVYTYGKGYAQAFTQVEMTARKKNLKLSYINAIQNVDNYLPFFDMKKEMEELPGWNVEGQIDQLLKDISERRHREVHPSETDLAEMERWHRTHAANILKKDTALGYTVNENCIRCGICARVCPADNISVTPDGIHFHDHCEVCYACLHNCPQSAIHMALEAGKIHFRNEHVTLDDIIKANG